MSQKNKSYRIGQFLYVFPLFILVGFIVYLFSFDSIPSKSNTCIILSVAVLISTFSSLLTGDIGIRGFGVVRKNVRPNLYWFQFGFQLLVGFGFLLVAAMVRG